MIWPKVIADGTRDTLISLTNTRNETAYAHCEYVNAISTCALTGTFCSIPNATPGSPGACEPIMGNVCTQQWREADFDVILTRQQPTFWRVSTGRVDNPFLPADGACDTIPGDAGPPPVAERQSCPGSSWSAWFRRPFSPSSGFLTCIQVAMDGGQVGSNGLKGEATIETVGSTQISTYNSINVEAVGDVAAVDGLVELNCVAYSACPAKVEVSHYGQGAQDLVAAEIDPSVCDPMEGCPVETEITLVPCRADFTSLPGAAWATGISYTDEFESSTSVDRPFECWANFDLRDAAFPPATSSTFAKTRFTPMGDGRCISGNINAVCDADIDCGTGGVCGPVTGILAIVEEFHNTAASLAVPPTSPAGTAASNGYTVEVDGSLEKAGFCRNDTDTTSARRIRSAPAGSAA